MWRNIIGVLKGIGVIVLFLLIVVGITLLCVKFPLIFPISMSVIMIIGTGIVVASEQGWVDF